MKNLAEKPIETCDAATANMAPKASAEVASSSPPENETDEESEEVDEEEALLASLEKEKEKEDAEEAAHPHPLPSDIHAAPKLLQQVLQKGDVKLPPKSDEAKIEEEKKNEDGDASGPTVPPTPEGRVSRSGDQFRTCRLNPLLCFGCCRMICEDVDT